MNLKSFKVAAAAIAMVGMVFTGCKGEDGDDGAAGNANVSSSNYEVVAGDWSQGQAHKMNGAITNGVVNSGTVQAFQATDSINSKVWTAIPAGNFAFSYRTDTITFLTPGFTGANFTTYYKVVAIPAAAKIDGVDLTNFEEVNMVYGLED